MMTQKKCTGCNRITQTKQVCCKCGSPLCSECRTNKMMCRDCLVIAEDKGLILEYFREKYAVKTLVFVFIALILSISAYSQISTGTDYKKTCWDVNADYIEKVPVYNSTVISWPNGTKENRTEFLRYDDVLVKRMIQKCNETVSIGNKDVDFKMQGYNCKNVTGTITCDSTSDGNGDGCCGACLYDKNGVITGNYDNGGETCIRITNGIPQYKNSVVSWNDKTGLIVAGKLQ